MGEFNLIWNALVPPREISDDAEIPDPVGSMFRRAAFPGSDTLAKSAGWDEPLGDVPKPLAKRENQFPFPKDLGVTRLEKRKIANDIWLYGFKNDELVASKLLLLGS